MFVRATRNLALVTLVSAVLVALSYVLLRKSHLYGPGVLAMTVLPLVAARLSGLRIHDMVPDLVFGGVDTGLLTVGAVIGASGFGIIGALVGAAVADAITDGLAGFAEGGVAEWLRAKGFKESRTAMGSACGKMAGCLAGSGLMLSLMQVLRVGVMHP
jgi:hypothetical protein